MKVLVVLASSNPESFNHAITRELTRGLRDSGHQVEVVDLYAIDFDPIYRARDGIWFFDHNVPEDMLEAGHLRERFVAGAGGPLRRWMARRWIRGRTMYEIVEMLMKQPRPKDVLAQQAKLAWADALVFVAPVIWMHYPAMLQGWIERVMSYSVIYSLTAEGWRGDVRGRIPLMKQRKALVVNTTFFSEDDYREGGYDVAMRKVLCDWGLRMPGIPDVQHVFFHAVIGCDDATRRGYLERAYQLGRAFEATPTKAEAHPYAA